MRVYARGVGTSSPSATERTAAGAMTPARRRRSATGPGRERGLSAIREQGRVVADYWKTLKARNR